jgi:hypothetical protein
MVRADYPYLRVYTPVQVAEAVAALLVVARITMARMLEVAAEVVAALRMVVQALLFTPARYTLTLQAP